MINKQFILKIAKIENQRLACLSLLDSLNEHSDSDYEITKDIMELKEACLLWINSRIIFRKVSILLDKYFLDEIRVYEGNLPHWNDEASVYYRSDAYKSSYYKKLANILGIPIVNDDFVLIANLKYLDFYYKDRVVYQLTKKVGLVVIHSKAEVVDPVCGVERTYLITRLLQSGINFYNPEIPLNTKQLKNFSSRKNISNRRAENNWENICKAVKGFESNVVLFNSGSMANEVAMYAIKGLGYHKAYMHPYWYYENINTAKTIFELTPKVEKASVFLLNLEPTNYISFFDTPVDTINVLRMILKLAIKNPNRSYILVIDCTVNPGFKIKIPNNVVLVKSVSTTKHQDGLRKYFSGICLINAHDKNTCQNFSKQLNRYRIKTGSVPEKATLQNFPIQTKLKLLRKVKLSEELNYKIALLCNKGKDSWYLTPYTFHAFFYPPKKEVLEFLNRIDLLSQEDLNSAINDFNFKINKVISNYVLGLNSPNFEYGDSFGLNITRINVQGDTALLPSGKKFRMKIPRICFNYKTSEEEARLVVQDLINRLNSENLFNYEINNK